jgi:hypothetical protein
MILISAPSPRLTPSPLLCQASMTEYKASMRVDFTALASEVSTILDLFVIVWLYVVVILGGLVVL